MTYINCAVIPVKTDGKDTYREMAASMARLFKKHGALQVIESWGDHVPDGEVTSFAKAVKLEADETVVLSLAIWPSKAVADEGKQKAMQDPEMKPPGAALPFDMKRMIFADFDPIVEV